jgi:hypothetical protein
MAWSVQQAAEFLGVRPKTARALAARGELQSSGVRDRKTAEELEQQLRSELCLDRTGWSLSPAYDLNPVPTDLKARVLTTNIDLDEGACSLATATATWRSVAQKVGARD